MSEIDDLERTVWGSRANCSPIDRRKLKPEVRKTRFMEANTRHFVDAGPRRQSPSLPKFKCLEKQD